VDAAHDFRRALRQSGRSSHGSIFHGASFHKNALRVFGLETFGSRNRITRQFFQDLYETSTKILDFGEGVKLAATIVKLGNASFRQRVLCGAEAPRSRNFVERDFLDENEKISVPCAPGIQVSGPTVSLKVSGSQLSHMRMETKSSEAELLAV
jgi:hypothetical protein